GVPEGNVSEAQVNHQSFRDWLDSAVYGKAGKPGGFYRKLSPDEGAGILKEINSHVPKIPDYQNGKELGRSYPARRFLKDGCVQKIVCPPTRRVCWEGKRGKLRAGVFTKTIDYLNTFVLRLLDEQSKGSRRDSCARFDRQTGN